MTSAEVKAALRRRHPAAAQGSMVGEWTCLEEWDNIDLVALSAWGQAAVVGYEVKVSRSDYRQELLAPAKRAGAVEICTEFYFAVPAALLKAEEVAFEEPEWQPGDFTRSRCPGVPVFGPKVRCPRFVDRDRVDHRYGGPCKGVGYVGTYKVGNWRRKGPFRLPLPQPLTLVEDPPDYMVSRWVGGERVFLEGEERQKALADWHHSSLVESERTTLCPTCGGRGYLKRSRVEEEAPTLWVPRDVGLVEITGAGCRVVKPSPKRPKAPGLVAGADRKTVAQLVRWASNRPDPRHMQSATLAEALAA